MRYARSRFRSKRSEEQAYRFRGTKEPFYTLNIISGTISVEDLEKNSRPLSGVRDRISQCGSAVRCACRSKKSSIRSGNAR